MAEPERTAGTDPGSGLYGVARTGEVGTGEEADAAGDPDSSAAHGIAPLLQRAHRAVSLARVAESGLLSATALLCVLAAVVGSGGELAQPSSWAVALLCALLAAGSWWLEKRPRPTRLASSVDGKLGLGGSFVTAWEAESGCAGGGGPLARLLSARLRGRVSQRQVLAAALPRSLPFAALPFLGAGLLALAIEGSRPQRAVPWMGELSGPLVMELELARGLLGGGGELAGELPPHVAGEAERLARAALASGAALERALARDADDVATLAPPTRALQEQLGELARLLPPESAAGAATERALSLTDAMAMALGLEAVAAPAGELRADGGGPGGESGEDDGQPPALGGSGEVATGAQLARGEAGQREDGPGHGEGAGTTLSSAGNPEAQAPAAQEGAVSGRWWPGHLDGIVRRWGTSERGPVEPR